MIPPHTVHERHLPAARREDLAALRAFVASGCREVGVDDAGCEALVLAADEVCANVVLHAYVDRAPGPLTVRVERVDDEALVTIDDAGPPFDPTGTAPPVLDLPLADRPIGGLGWHLVRQVVHALRYERTPHGNRVTLVRRAST